MSWNTVANRHKKRRANGAYGYGKPCKCCVIAMGHQFGHDAACKNRPKSTLGPRLRDRNEGRLICGVTWLEHQRHKQPCPWPAPVGARKEEE